jgi:uncharacterized protein (UPF0262 family)
VTDAPADPTARIIGLSLDERTVVRRNADIEHERAIAIFDILEENLFRHLPASPGRSICSCRSRTTG